MEKKIRPPPTLNEPFSLKKKEKKKEKKFLDKKSFECLLNDLWMSKCIEGESRRWPKGQRA